MRSPGVVLVEVDALDALRRLLDAQAAETSDRMLAASAEGWSRRLRLVRLRADVHGGAERHRLRLDAEDPDAEAVDRLVAGFVALVERHGVDDALDAVRVTLARVLADRGEVPS